ncbi:MAG: iron-containing alcohol dehydrogenase, partial [Pseudomonadales bacterium]|nr:iron-containing alcohol dehydrogenase [Pseudomonadales bacterium]
VFGRGILDELGERAAARGLKRVALFTDARLAALEPVARAKASLAAAGLEAVVFDEVLIEPDVDSVEGACRFLLEGRFDGTISVGGGSVMDSCKAASMLASYPGELQAFLPPPNGEGRKVPGPVMPHIACPTTAGTGSEVTPLSVIDFPALGAKIPILSRFIMPDEAIVDPTCTYSLPREVAAASAFDLVSHAIEGYTARPFCQRPKAAGALTRVPIQGANPWSDLFCREALGLAARYLVRSVTDASDEEARDGMSWGATLAGIGFGNCGTHAPHAMGYPVSSLNRSFPPEAYPSDKPMVPHGYSVIVNSPSVFRFTAHASPERHLDAAGRLGAETRGAAPEDAG